MTWSELLRSQTPGARLAHGESAHRSGATDVEIERETLRFYASLTTPASRQRELVYSSHRVA